MGMMDTSIDVDTFLRSIHATKPPWECPKCQKIYKSYSGIEHHMLNFDHSTVTKSPGQKPTPGTGRKPGRFKLGSRKKGGRSKNSNTPRRSPSPIGFTSPARETLTWAEAQRMVEVESEGKIYRLDINEKLDIISDSDVDKDDESNSGNSSDHNNDCNAEAENLEKKNDQEKEEKGKPEQCGKNKEGGKLSNINSKDLKNVTLPIQQYGNANDSEPASAKLPVPCFRVINEYEKEAEDAPDRHSAYYRYIEKSLDELAEEVEYDMDEEDSVWLELMNEQRSKESQQVVTADQFELLMDRFEKESYFEQARNGDHQRVAQQMIDEDAVCCVCNDGECQNSNVILFCDMCNLAVHQECYGVPYIPEGQWLCRRCLQSPSCPVDCCLCPNRGGAFKQTDDGRWSHVVCALWVPEVTFANTVFLEPIDGLKRIPAARWKLSCYICKQRNSGACIQCHRTNCYTAFHVTCAQQAGLYMKMEPVRETGKNGVTITVRKAAFCDLHRPADASPSRPMKNNIEYEETVKEREKQALNDSREKMKKARKILAEKRQEMPHIAIPYIPRAKMSTISKLVTIQKRGTFMQRLLSYWTLKRQSRNGVPLLRRLQSNLQSQKNCESNASSQEQNELIKQLKYWQRLRHDLERARLLIELIRKREKLKREQIKLSQAAAELELSPWRAHLLKTLERLKTLDTAKVFALPVNVRDAPEYDKIIKHPMDFSTMEKKINAYEYRSMDQFDKDVSLIVNNCMLYNTRDTIFFRLALKLRDQGGVILRLARKDATKIGFDTESGLLLKEIPVYEEESPTKTLMEVERLIEGEARTDLSLNDQLANLLDKLDFMMSLKNGIGRSYKIKKLRIEIKKMRRKISQAQKESAQHFSNVDNHSASDLSDVASDADGRTLSKTKVKVGQDYSDDSKSNSKMRKNSVIDKNRKTEKENKFSASHPGSLSRSISSPSSSKKTKLHRKRLWSNLSENSSNEREAKRERRNKNFNALPETRCGDSGGILSNIESSTVFQDNATNGNSVNRRTAVLFNKKPKQNSNPVSRQNSEELKTNDRLKGHLSDSSLTHRPVSISQKPRSKSLNQRRTSLRKARSSDSSSESSDKVVHIRKKLLTNGFLPASEKKSSKPESFLVYREETVHHRTSSDSDTTSSSSSLDTNKRNSKNAIYRKRAKILSRRSSYSVGERRHADDASSPVSSNDIDSDDNRENTKPSLLRKRRRTTGSSSTEEDNESCTLQPLDLVWAKCRGYPSYPALIIDPNMPRTGYFHNGVPIPVPPYDVLKVGEAKIDTNHHSTHLYLVLFFDNKRTWQWLPHTKLKPLGVDEKSDQMKLYEGKRPGIRKSVTQAYQRAILHKSKVSGEIPDSDEEIIRQNEDLREDESSDSVN